MIQCKVMHQLLPFCFTLLSFCFLSSSAALGFGDSFGLSPFWDWKTIETEHFRVSFPNHVEPIAQKSARYAEEAYDLLTEKLYWTPRTKTQILVIDNADLANGLASASLRFGMVLMTTPPDNWFSTSYYDNWLRLVILHEFTHFLNIDVTENWVEILRWIFGDGVRPNALWPQWMLEGLAVYNETRYTKGGRGRSTLYESILRAAIDANVLDTDAFMTLDRINGPAPYYPSGEIPYLFGYQLFSKIARDPHNKLLDSTFDNRDYIEDTDDIHGLMSQRSGSRVPFFINGNLENLTGKDWYDYWRSWVKETRLRMKTQLEKVGRYPITEPAWVTSDAIRILGTSSSPDGKLLAYTEESLHDRTALYIFDLEKKTKKRIVDKVFGVSSVFSNDGRFIFYSGLVRHKQYYLFSDLFAYDLKSGKEYCLTSGLRARDPDISPDGRWITFTKTDLAKTHVAIAPLSKDKNGRPVVGPHRILYRANDLDRASTPKFLKDGKHIVFSYHPDGKVREDIMMTNIKTGKTERIVGNSAFNRFLSVSSKGELYFTSDQTGVDNIYRISADRIKARKFWPVQATNVKTGAWFPAMTSKGELYASVLTYKGWNLAKVEPTDYGYRSPRLQVSPPPAPDPVSPKQINNKKTWAVEDYSVWPSILPRSWMPVISYGGDTYYLGGNVSGFDATDRHRYSLFGGYDSLIKKPDAFGSYSNRVLGATVTAFGSYSTSQLRFISGELASYKKLLNFGASVSFPFRWTFSVLVPSVSFSAQREFGFVPLSSSSSETSRYVPLSDLVVSYSNSYRSRLGVASEKGWDVTTGVRGYHDPAKKTWKGLLTIRRNIHLLDHVTLNPRIRASMTSKLSPYLPANVLLQGRSGSFGPSASLFDQLPLRGYPKTFKAVRAASVNSVDLNFPIWRVFRGIGTNPFYFKDVTGFVFGESTYLPPIDRKRTRFLNSAGTGFRLNFDLLLNVPLSVGSAYHHGFKKSEGGKGEFIFSVLLGSIGLQ